METDKWFRLRIRNQLYPHSHLRLEFQKQIFLQNVKVKVYNH